MLSGKGDVLESLLLLLLIMIVFSTTIRKFVSASSDGLNQSVAPDVRHHCSHWNRTIFFILWDRSALQFI